MKNAQIDNLHILRRSYVPKVTLKAFNDWRKKRLGKTLKEMKVGEYAEVVKIMDEEFGQAKQEAPTPPPAPVVEAPTPPPPPVTPPPEAPAPAPVVEAPVSIVSRKKKVICFYMSTIWQAIRMEPLIDHFKSKHPEAVVAYQFGFKPPKEKNEKIRGRFFDSRFRDKIAKDKGGNGDIYPFMPGGQDRYGEADLLAVCDPSDKKLKNLRAKKIIGIQPDILLHPQMMAKAISTKFERYLVWSKLDKGKVKSAGVHGNKLMITGSHWLTYLHFMSRRPKREGAQSAVIFIPNPDVIPTRNYFTTTKVAEMLRQMGYEVHVMRYRGQQHWFPPFIRIVLDALSFHSTRNWRPAVAIAALEVPVLRLSIGQAATEAFIKSAQVEELPDQYINLGCMKKISNLICELTDLQLEK